MKKFFIALGLVASFGVANAQSDFASVDLTVNLNPVASIELVGSASIDVNTIDDWTGANLVYSNTILGTTTTTGSSSNLDIMGGFFAEPTLDMAIDLVVNGVNHAHGILNGHFTSVPVAIGVQPLDVTFHTNGTNLLGVPASSYFTVYDFYVYSY